MKHLIDAFNQCSMHDASESILKLYDDVSEIKELDNRGILINRPLFSHSSLPDTFGTDAVHVKEFDFKEPFIYFVCVHHNTNLWAKHINKIPKIILDNVRNGYGKLVFDDTMEGAPYKKFLNIIYKSIDELNLPADKLYFVTNNLLAESTHEKWKSSNNIRKYINLFSFMYNVHDIQRLKKIPCLPDSIIMEDELKYKKDNLHNIKHFLKVNRTDRWERNLFMLHMNKNNILENSLVSFPQFQDMDQMHLIRKSSLFFYNLTTTDNINSLRSKTPFNIDVTDETNVGDPGHEVGMFNADLPFDPIHYKNSLISLVMCAFPFQENACHLHSSTYNPMFCGHPVIQFGPYQHLKQMKKNGFKTFSKWWDESYDDEIDGVRRLKMVMDISDNISKMPIENVFDMIVDMKQVLQHNSDLINNYNVKDNLIKKYLMNNNFYNGKISLIVSEELNYSFPPHVDLYVGTIEECYTKIKKYELDNDEFYTGHLILNNKSLFVDIKELVFTQYFNNIDTTYNVLFTQEINHSGHSTECYLNEDIMYCNSFVFAIVANASRTNNNIYGDCISHRIELKLLTMRIAVCLSGQLRNWELAYSNQINHWLYGGHEVDYFTHTWDYSADRTHISTDYVNRNIKYEEYDRFIETYKPKKSIFDSKNKVFYGNDHWSSLFYGFSQSILLKREYELENGFEYDIVVKSRPDVIFNPHRGPSWPTIEEEKTNSEPYEYFKETHYNNKLFTTHGGYMPHEFGMFNINDCVFYQTHTLWI